MSTSLHWYVVDKLKSFTPCDAELCVVGAGYARHLRLYQLISKRAFQFSFLALTDTDSADGNL